MPTRLCDRCGQLIEEGALRYIAKIQVYAAYEHGAAVHRDEVIAPCWE
jgi:hypothetical protein